MLPSIELIDKNLVKGIANSYQTLMLKPNLKNLLLRFFQENELDHFSKYELHQYINQIISQNHEGEQVIKHLLAREFIQKNVIGAFEVNVNESRLDFIAINSHSLSFEIKTANDDLRKLERQILDYSTVFDYNYVVLHEKHIDNALPQLDENIGIWSFINDKKRVVRRAKRNVNLDPRKQLSILTQKELRTYFSASCKNIDELLLLFTPKEINAKMRDVLKIRYSNRWNFIAQNWGSIFPIDLQFFFNSNIEPSIIYSV